MIESGLKLLKPSAESCGWKSLEGPSAVARPGQGEYKSQTNLEGIIVWNFLSLFFYRFRRTLINQRQVFNLWNKPCISSISMYSNRYHWYSSRLMSCHRTPERTLYILYNAQGVFENLGFSFFKEIDKATKTIHLQNCFKMENLPTTLCLSCPSIRVDVESLFAELSIFHFFLKDFYLSLNEI